MSSTAHEAATQLRTLLGRAGQRLRPGSAPAAAPDADRWLVVTVEGSPDDVAPGGVLPAPLAALGDSIEVDLRPAPAGQGTEIAARLTPATAATAAADPADPADATGPDRQPSDQAAVEQAPSGQEQSGDRQSGEQRAEPDPSDEDTSQQLRVALRQAKQLIEVGEVLIAEPRPEGYRPRTIAGRLVDRAERAAGSRGVL